MADKALTRKWIEFLKNNRIVSPQSDQSGKLKYKRSVNSADLVRFLTNNTHYDEETIHSAIEQALGRGGEEQPKQLQGNGEQPQNQVAPHQQNQQQNQQQNPVTPPPQDQSPQKNQAPQLTAPKPSKWNNADAEYVDYKDVPDEPESTEIPQLHYSGRPNARGGKKAGIVSQTPNAIRKREARARKKTLAEDFVDQTVDLSEKNVEDVFDILDRSSTDQQGDQDQQDHETAQATPAEINKVKDLIKTGMNSTQRKMLWQALQDSSLNEEHISRKKAKAILQGVIDNKSYGRLKNKNLTISDLQKAWKDEGFSTDTQELGDLLQKVGFGSKEIHRVFHSVLGGNSDYDDEDDPHSPPQKPSPAVIKIAEYIKKHGFQDEIISFMQKTFGDELKPNEPEPDKKGFVGKAMDWARNKFGKKQATVEEIRQIFTAMLLEERTERENRIKEEETKLFGRSKK
jgi:hypothetical protein